MRHCSWIVALTLAAAPACGAERAAYIGVIDAGSSGSRLHVYRLGERQQDIDDVLEISATASPLASYASAPATAGDKAISPLLARLDRELAERGVSKTSLEIHLIATAGMRRLPTPAAQAIEASARRAIGDAGYTPGRVETASGEMEGFYAWLDVNVLLGRLAPGKSPAGIVEIGGASMQIAYAGAPASDPGVVTASFAGASYSVRSVSYLGLGVELARKALMDAGDGGACYPTGLVSAMPDLNSARGEFNAEVCARSFAPILGALTPSLPRSEITGLDFVGVGRPLSGVLADWRLAPGGSAALKDTAREKCRLPWPQFTRDFGDTPYTPYLCVNSVYLSTLLFDPAGLGLAGDRIIAADRIAGRRPSWTRGAALMLRTAN